MNSRQPLLLFGLGGTIVTIDKGLESKNDYTSFRTRFECLLLKCIKLGYQVGIYTILEENNMINIINCINESVDFRYILTSIHCKNVKGKLVKCLDHIDTSKYLPILIANERETIDTKLLPFTVVVPFFRHGDNFDMMSLYPLLKQVYQVNDIESIIELIKNWNQRKDDSICIIS